MSYRERLTPHGRTVSVCKNVIENFKDREDYKDNKTVQLWVADSIKCLYHKDCELDNRYDNNGDL